MTLYSTVATLHHQWCLHYKYATVNSSLFVWAGTFLGTRLASTKVNALDNIYHLACLVSALAGSLVKWVGDSGGGLKYSATWLVTVCNNHHSKFHEISDNICKYFSCFCVWIDVCAFMGFHLFLCFVSFCTCVIICFYMFLFFPILCICVIIGFYLLIVVIIGFYQFVWCCMFF